VCWASWAHWNSTWNGSSPPATRSSSRCESRVGGGSAAPPAELRLRPFTRCRTASLSGSAPTAVLAKPSKPPGCDVAGGDVAGERRDRLCLQSDRRERLGSLTELLDPDDLSASE
jgi:hypothetical protein